MESKYKIIRYILKYTSLDKKFPTDKDLDTKMALASLHISELEKDIKYIIKKKIGLLLKYKWYEVLIRLLLLSCFVVGSYYIYKLVVRPTLIKYIINEKVSDIEKSINDHPMAQGNIDFMVAIRQLEGSNNYKAIRSWTEIIKGKKVLIYSQYWGAYQEGDLCRKAVGLSDMPMDKFLNDKAIQDWAMNEYMNVNYQYLYKYIAKYKIPTYGGIKIYNNLVTISGLIAASHLVGYNSVVLFLEKGIITCDGNGIPLTKYLQLNNIKLTFK